MTDVSYGASQDVWTGFATHLRHLIEKNGLRSVCDIGGGANPQLDAEYIRQNGLDYCILDISRDELRKAPEQYTKIEANIAAADFKLDQKFDLVFSKMLAEHISNAEQFHKNVLGCMSDNGLAVHFFPTLYAPPFLVNYLIPERVSSILLNAVAPRDRYQHEKFPAYYRWCRGPTRNQIHRFKSLGYEIVEYRGLFGHGGYYNRLKPLKRIHDAITSYLISHPNPNLTSFAYIVLKKA